MCSFTLNYDLFRKTCFEEKKERSKRTVGSRLSSYSGGIMKKLIVAIVLITAMVGFAFAEPTGAITHYRFGTEAGGFLEPQWYTGAGFEKFMATTEFNGQANFGFATRVGGEEGEDGGDGIYLGLYYGGDIFNKADFGYTKANQNFPIASSGSKEVTSYGNVYTALQNGGRDHNFAVLIGIADMGIKFSLASDRQSFKDDDVIMTGIGGPTNNYKSMELSYGTVTPKIKWGMAKNLTDDGIRPAVELGLGFFKDYVKYEGYLADGTVRGEFIGVSGNYTDISLWANLGGYTFYRAESGFSAGFDFTYELSSVSYGENEYSWRLNVADNWTTKTFKGYYDGSNYVTDPKAATHTITPEVNASWNSDKFGIGAVLKLPIGIMSGSGTGNTLDGANGSLSKANEVKISGIGFAPEIGIGAQYRIIPDKFILNAGATIGLSMVGKVETETTTILGGTTTTETVVVRGSDGTSSSFSVGFNFYFTPNAWVEAFTGARDTDEFNLFGDGANSLSSFTGILFALKF